MNRKGFKNVWENQIFLDKEVEGKCGKSKATTLCAESISAEFFD